MDKEQIIDWIRGNTSIEISWFDEQDYYGKMVRMHVKLIDRKTKEVISEEFDDYFVGEN